GANFTGYEITSATQTITRWRPFVGTGGEFWTKVQLFGEQLPRPPVYPPLTGDYNKNGTVDAADYVVWRELMSRPEGSRPDLPNAVAGPRPPMDGDYGPWRYFFGESVPPISGASAVPEPATWLPAILALCCICRTARRVPLASPVQSAFNIDPAYRSTHRE
ncbi:MAG TPA: hypothetical protein VHK01_11965, partial [Lacipirellulaceae bacterium]|nr:hypothetical protein [Lacipirellulaceae bacterium]